jgi:hypothetical protein
VEPSCLLGRHIGIQDEFTGRGPGMRCRLSVQSAVAAALLCLGASGCAESDRSALPRIDQPTKPVATATVHLSKIERYLQRTGRYRERLHLAVVRAGQFASAEVQPARKRFIVWGVGDPATDVAAIIDDAPRDLEIVWRHAPYTERELGQEVERIMGRFPQIHSGSLRDDATGIVLTTTDRDLLKADNLKKRIGSRFPVTLQFGPPPSPA